MIRELEEEVVSTRTEGPRRIAIFFQGVVTQSFRKVAPHISQIVVLHHDT